MGRPRKEIIRARITVSMPPEVLETLEGLAKIHGQTHSAFVAGLVIEEAKRQQRRERDTRKKASPQPMPGQIDLLDNTAAPD